MKAIVILLLVFFSIESFSQNDDFNIIIQNPATDVKFQLESGQYCWSYATCSFMESELLRTNKERLNLSEDFFIYHAYVDKAMNYLLRQGKSSFKNGGLAHDVFRIVATKGIVPDLNYKIDYIPYTKGPTDVLASYLNTILKDDVLPENWKKHYLALLNSYFIDCANQFLFKNNDYSPSSFAEYLGINVDDYISITSFTHHPFDKEFVLELPDNYASGSFLNVPLSDFNMIVDTCLMKGYTLVWDGCILGNGYSYERGLAMEPVEKYNKNLDLRSTTQEIEINQLNRQNAFERLQTTDDHLMHITGIAKNMQGKKFYVVKDSGGEYGPYGGYLYMSEAFFKMKTIAITVNKESLPGSVKLMLDTK